MIIFLIALAALCCWGLEWKPRGIHDTYLSIEQTTAIRGIFACIILFSHLRDYITLEGPADALFVRVIVFIGQCMVSVFFFYSGYGIVSSYRKKAHYQNGFLRKRLLVTWVHFACAVTAFAAVNLLMRIPCSWKSWLIALTGWDSIGNSNWYMFDTFALYLIVWLAMKAVTAALPQGSGEEKSRLLVCICTALVGVLILVLMRTRPSWWYDTLLCFALGGAYRLIQAPLDRFCGSGRCHAMLGIALLVLFLLFCTAGGAAAYNIRACLFVLLICWLTLRVRISNPVLLWLGQHSFYIYIYMRIPMMAARRLGLFSGNKYLFSLAAMALTLAIAWGVRLFHRKTDPLFLTRP